MVESVYGREIESCPYWGESLARRPCPLPDESPQEPRQVGVGSALPASPSTGLTHRQARGMSGE